MSALFIPTHQSDNWLKKIPRQAASAKVGKEHRWPQEFLRYGHLKMPSMPLKQINTG